MRLPRRFQSGRNLHGNVKVIDVYGDDAGLDALLDKLECCSGMEVLDRRDAETEGQGILFIQTKRTQELYSMVKELELRTGGQG